MSVETVLSYLGAPLGIIGDGAQHEFISYSMDPDTLAANGDALEIEVFGRCVLDTLPKTLRLLANDGLLGQMAITPGNDTWQAKFQLVRVSNSVCRRTRTGISVTNGTPATNPREYVAKVQDFNLFEWDDAVVFSLTGQYGSVVNSLPDAITVDCFRVQVVS